MQPVALSRRKATVEPRWGGWPLRPGENAARGNLSWSARCLWLALRINRRGPHRPAFFPVRGERLRTCRRRCEDGLIATSRARLFGWSRIFSDVGGFGLANRNFVGPRKKGTAGQFPFGKTRILEWFGETEIGGSSANFCYCGRISRFAPTACLRARLQPRANFESIRNRECRINGRLG